jgi:hypothetical protein
MSIVSEQKARIIAYTTMIEYAHDKIRELVQGGTEIEALICSHLYELDKFNQAVCDTAYNITEPPPEHDCRETIMATVPSPMTWDTTPWICPRNCPVCLIEVREDVPCENGHEYRLTVNGTLCFKCGTKQSGFEALKARAKARMDEKKLCDNGEHVWCSMNEKERWWTQCARCGVHK